MRIKALPPESSLWSSVRAEGERAKAEQEAADVEDALAPFIKPNGA